LFAVSGSLAGLPANALELGDVTVESRLGQPLRASIAYALAPHEQLSDSCVTLGLGAPASGLPGVGRATLSIADGTILLTGNRPVREPMVSAMINVDCPYTANLRREYLMFIDPATPAFDSQAAATVSSPSSANAATAATPVRRTATRNAPRARAASPKVDQSPITTSGRYRVQPGDTLSEIVQRIENRSASLWPSVNAIFDANPDAFINDDPNRLKAGSLLTIPGSVSSQPQINAVADTTSDSSVTPDIAASADASTSSPTMEIVESESVSIVSDSTTDLRPATEMAPDDNPFVDGREIPTETLVIPDTELDGPVTISTSPNVATAVVNNDSTQTTPSSSSWLLWLAGSGLALIAALLLFGRFFRGRPSEPKLVADVVPQRRATDHEPRVLQEDSGIEVITHTDYTIEDDSPTSENVALDADLVLGTGLDTGTEMDMEVAQDFGFATPTELDLELPFEPQPSVPESDTGIFATDNDDTAALENDGVADDDYDLSVVLDATKMPQPDEITQQDLQAVEIEPADNAGKTDNYLIDTQVDLEILEQDYEDELTATQALNSEILRAAEELAQDLQTAESGDYEITSEMTAATPLASVKELDATAQLPRQGDDSADNEDTGIHQAATVEMPAAENDETAEMDVDGGKVDTKAV
jgi:murein DD-endopeptidase MepM/ murein hydrolase activator NlpD